MTDPGVFDEYAAKYRDVVNTSIAITGDTVEHFARIRARLIHRQLLGRRGLRFLDFGCGTGMSTVALANTVSSPARVVGSDPSADSIAEARRSLASSTASLAPEFVEQPGERLPFDDAAFDIVFTSCVFHHIERDEHAHWVREIHRVLAAGGSFFLFEHNPINPLTRRAVAACPFDEGVVLLQPRYARQLLHLGRFDVASPQFYYFFPHFAAPLRVLEPWMGSIPLGAQYFIRGRKLEP